MAEIPTERRQIADLAKGDLTLGEALKNMARYTSMLRALEEGDTTLEEGDTTLSKLVTAIDFQVGNKVTWTDQVGQASESSAKIPLSTASKIAYFTCMTVVAEGYNSALNKIQR